MKTLILTMTLFVLFVSCNKKNSNTTNNTNVLPSYIGTYVGKDSVETYNGSTLLATNVYNKSFVVIESNISGKNSFLIDFQGNDTIQSNFSNGIITIFGSTSPTIFNFNGTYANNSIEYYLEINNTLTQKTYGKYNKQ